MELLAPVPPPLLLYPPPWIDPNPPRPIRPLPLPLLLATLRQRQPRCCPLGGVVAPAAEVKRSSPHARVAVVVVVVAVVVEASVFGTYL